MILTKKYFKLKFEYTLFLQKTTFRGFQKKTLQTVTLRGKNRRTVENSTTSTDVPVMEIVKKSN